MLARHDDPAKEWGALGSQELTPSAIFYGTHVNSRMEQGGGPGARARYREVYSWDRKTKARGNQWDRQADVSGLDGRTPDDGVMDMVTEVAEVTQAGVGDHGFQKQGMTALFDIHIVYLYTDSYLRMTLEKWLTKVEKDKKDRYLQICL